MTNKNQTEIMKNWGSKKEPLVSIVSITYNHENFIEQALDSFLMQETSFPFEIIIHDDASTDNTAFIINKYAKKYPDLIIPFLKSENQFSKGIRPTFLFSKLKGKYIAFCEGDDFWTHPLKLQKQVDLMEKNQEHSLCFHPVKVFFQNNDERDMIYPKITDPKYFKFDNLLRANFIQTNSVMYRKKEYTSIKLDNILPVDWLIHLYHAESGSIGFINETMSSYRRHKNGVWWNAYKNSEALFNQYGVQHFNLYIEMMRRYGTNRYHKNIILNNMINLIKIICEIDMKTDQNLIEKVLKYLPNDIINLLTHAMYKKKSHVISSLSINTGYGFNEYEVTHSLPSLFPDNEFYVKFDLSDFSFIKHLQFKPIENDFTKIALTKVVYKTRTGNAKELDLQSIQSNGFVQEDGFTVFYTLNPKFIMQAPEDIGQIEIYGKWRLLDKNELDKELNSVYSSYSWKIGRIITWLPRRLRQLKKL